MNYLILADKFNPVPKEFINELELIYVRDKLIEKTAGINLKALLNAAENDFIKLEVISAYRTAEYQQRLWDKSIKSELEKGLTLSQAKAEISKTLALPQCSEHNTGLAVDFGRENADDVEDDFYKSAQAKWLCKNAAAYGFILRYPRLKEHITGISYEPWHYRYVGTKAAEIIKESGICFEEFLHFYSGDFCKNN